MELHLQAPIHFHGVHRDFYCRLRMSVRALYPGDCIPSTLYHTFAVFIHADTSDLQYIKAQTLALRLSTISTKNGIMKIGNFLWL
jgi:hypothetical protein